MIPKTIHYCWFGGAQKSKRMRQCIDSWGKYCPDYNIVEWNENNFNVNATPYTRYCYKNKLWAYLSDYARLAVIYENGGVYFDTDVELIKSIDHLLPWKAFFAMEDDQTIATGLGFGAESGSTFLKALMEPYGFSCEDDVTVTSCPEMNTRALIPFGVKPNGKRQELDGLLILPIDYMNPYDDPTGRLRITDNTVSIHWYSKSALSKKAIIRSKLTRPFHRLFGVGCFQWLKRPNGS